MARRKPDPANTNQLDMFGTLVSEPANHNAISIADETAATELVPANDTGAVIASASGPDPVQSPALASAEPASSEPADPSNPSGPAAIVTSTRVWVDDEWWTLAMVCAYLKLGRKAVWARKRDPGLGFPQPVCLGSSRPRWRGGEVRAWAAAQT